MSLPRLASPERKCPLKLLKWVASSSLPGPWVPGLGEGRWKVQGRKLQLCYFDFKTPETWQITTTSQRAVPGDRRRARKQLWKGCLVWKNSKVAKICRWGVLMGPALAAPQQQAPAEGLQSRWRLLWTSGNCSQRGLAIQLYPPIPSPGGTHILQGLQMYLPAQFSPAAGLQPVLHLYSWQEDLFYKQVLKKKKQMLSSCI